MNTVSVISWGKPVAAQLGGGHSAQPGESHPGEVELVSSRSGQEDVLSSGQGLAVDEEKSIAVRGV